MIKGTSCPKELTVQRAKQAYRQPFSTEEVGVAEEPMEEKVGSFLAKCFVLALFLLDMQFQAASAFIMKKRNTNKIIHRKQN